MILIEEVEHRLAAQHVDSRLPGLHRVGQLSPMLPMPLVAPEQN
jgi:hypothetical protein